MGRGARENVGGSRGIRKEGVEEGRERRRRTGQEEVALPLTTGGGKKWAGGNPACRL